MRRYFANVGVRAVQPSAEHGPVKRSTRQTCDHCRQGTSGYVCAACGKHLHIKCFVATHDTYFVMDMRGIKETVVEAEASCYPCAGDQCKPYGNPRVGRIPNCENPPLTHTHT